ncbi:unnamed protein product [Bubo scandiacus]
MGAKETWLGQPEVPQALEDLDVAQHRLDRLKQEMATVSSQITAVNQAADGLLASGHPRSPQVRQCREQLNERWDRFRELVAERCRAVGSALRLLNYRLECEETRQWLRSKAQAVQATAELGQDLAGVLATQRKLYGIERELAIAQDRLATLRSQANRLAEEQPERLRGVEAGWAALGRMAEAQHRFLAQCCGFQEFLRDAKQAEILLTNQEYTLAHLELPTTLEGSTAALRRFQDFRASVESSAEKVPEVVASGTKLVAEGNIFAEKITEKCQALQERHRAVAAKAEEAAGLLQDNHELQTFLQSCQELHTWVEEKMLTAQDVSYGEARGLHGKWQKHQAFMAELAPNQGWLEKIETVGAGTRGEGAGEPQAAVQRGGGAAAGRAARAGWDGLCGAAEEKGRRLFEANRSALYAQSYGELESWLGQAEEELRATEQAKDLTATNLLLKRLMRLEEQVGARMKELEDLGWQGLPTAGDVPDADRHEQRLRQRFLDLLEPLERRRKELETAKAIYQLGRDLEDETLWVQERLPLARSTEYGTDLPSVQRLAKRNETLQKELAGHAPPPGRGAEPW